MEPLSTPAADFSSPTTSTAERIAATLRAEIIGSHADGDRLGSAEDLAERFAVSEPTVRQALRVLEVDGLVSARRGNSGGYFASTPAVEVVSRATSALLRRRGTQLHELMVCAQLLMPETAALAATGTDITGREALADYIESAWAPEETNVFATALQVSIEMSSRIGDLCANPPLALFAQVIRDVALDLQPEVLPTLDPAMVDKMAARAREGQLLLAGALRSGDAGTARLAMQLLNTVLLAR